MKYVIIILLFFFASLIHSCSSNNSESFLKIENGSLFNISNVRTELNNKTLTIEYVDESFIYDEDYNSLKSNKLVYYNYDKLSSFENVVVKSNHEGYKSFTHQYKKSDLDFIKNLHSKNKAFSSITEEITSNISLSELLAFKNGIKTINEMQGVTNQDYITLLLIISQASQDEVDTLQETERLRIFCEMIIAVGFNDAFSDKPIDPKPLVSKISNFFELVGSKMSMSIEK